MVFFIIKHRWKVLRQLAVTEVVFHGTMTFYLINLAKLYGLIIFLLRKLFGWYAYIA